MKGIMFNEKYGLESAVLNGTKTRTWRADKQPRYEVGEVVAIKQSYMDVCNYFRMKGNREYENYIASYSGLSGWRNKMFVKNELMPHHIRITAVKKCRLQDLTDEECLREGIKKIEKGYAIFFNGLRTSHNIVHENPKTLFAYLIQLLNGSGYWESNLEGYAYEFELVK